MRTVGGMYCVVIVCVCARESESEAKEGMKFDLSSLLECL